MRHLGYFAIFCLEIHLQTFLIIVGDAMPIALVLQPLTDPLIRIPLRFIAGGADACASACPRRSTRRASRTPARRLRSWGIETAPGAALCFWLWLSLIASIQAIAGTICRLNQIGKLRERS